MSRLHFTLSIPPSCHIALGSTGNNKVPFWQASWQDFIIYQHWPAKHMCAHLLWSFLIDFRTSVHPYNSTVAADKQRSPLDVVFFVVLKLLVIFNQNSRLQLEQGDIGSVGAHLYSDDVAVLSGRLAGSLCVDSQDHLVGCRPCAPS